MDKNNLSEYSMLLTPKDEHSIMALPAYEDTELDYVIGDDFGTSVIWIKDAHIYSLNGEDSLSFLFATSRHKTRFTARVLDHPSIRDHDDNIIFMYRVKMLVKIGSKSEMVDLLLCETALMDAPAIISNYDSALFS